MSCSVGRAGESSTSARAAAISSNASSMTGRGGFFSASSRASAVSASCSGSSSVRRRRGRVGRLGEPELRSAILCSILKNQQVRSSPCDAPRSGPRDPDFHSTVPARTARLRDTLAGCRVTIRPAGQEAVIRGRRGIEFKGYALMHAIYRTSSHFGSGFTFRQRNTRAKVVSL
jgi:hypothetical protein